MIDISLSPNLAEIEKWLGPEFAKQARFALASSLSKTAVGAKVRLQGTLPADFTIRSKWTAGSIRTTPATKSTLQATVGSTASYMALQATGGLKVGRTGKDVAVPVGARPTRQTKTTPATFPSRLLRKKKGFAVILPTDSGVQGVWVLKGNRKKPHLRLMWLLKKKVEIKPTWDFAGQVQTYVALEWPRRIAAALDAALKDPGKKS